MELVWILDFKYILLLLLLSLFTSSQSTLHLTYYALCSSDFYNVTIMFVEPYIIMSMFFCMKLSLLPRAVEHQSPSNVVLMSLSTTGIEFDTCLLQVRHVNHSPSKTHTYPYCLLFIQCLSNIHPIFIPYSPNVHPMSIQYLSDVY